MRDGFWDLLDLIREKAMTVRAIADVLSVVDAHELEADTTRSLGMLIPPGRQRFASNRGRLAEIGSIFTALERLGPGAELDMR
jgi:hypothetical protein